MSTSGRQSSWTWSEVPLKVCERNAYFNSEFMSLFNLQLSNFKQIRRDPWTIDTFYFTPLKRLEGGFVRRGVLVD